MMRKSLLALSFIEGAAVMAAELCGAKLLAPVFGSSLYVWASVMGVTLTALAAGYFYGGMRSAAAKDQPRGLFNMLVSASLFLILMPVISYYLLQRISYLPFIPAVLSGTLALLFFPVFFLGATSPFFIALQSAGVQSAGRVSGVVYAVSTAGGILSTFLSGFLLIPEAGLNVTLITFGALLFGCTLLVFRIYRFSSILFFCGFLFLNFQITAAGKDLLLYHESILGRLELQDVTTENGETRVLKINNIIQSEMDVHSGRSVSAYVALLDRLIPPRKGQALVLGLGGGLTANLLQLKGYEVTGVEFDQRIIDAAVTYFRMDPGVRAVCADARYFMNQNRKKYDLVLFDVFKAEEQPDHVITVESLRKLKNDLNENALVFINWHGYTKGKLGEGTAVMHNTLKAAGFQVKLCSFSNDENYRNIVFAAASGKMEALPMDCILNEPLPDLKLVNSDDTPLLEKYNAAANKAWRSNYLRYYQSAR